MASIGGPVYRRRGPPWLGLAAGCGTPARDPCTPAWRDGPRTTVGGRGGCSLGPSVGLSEPWWPRQVDPGGRVVASTEDGVVGASSRRPGNGRGRPRTAQGGRRDHAADVGRSAGCGAVTTPP